LEVETEIRRVPTPKELKAKIDLEISGAPAQGPPEEVTFLGLFKRFLDESKSGLRQSVKGTNIHARTIKKYTTTYNRLISFSKRYHLTFETIDSNFYSKFVSFLNKEGYALNTVGKHIQVVKTFLNYATENGYNKNLYYQSKNFKTFNVAGHSIYLNEGEIQDLYRLDLSQEPHLETVRDLFIVGCWTGLRFSDFTNISPENIEGDFIHIKTAKTGEKVIIPIHPTVREIMAKYAGKFVNSLPPARSNTRMNVNLKEISKRVKSLHKEVTTEQIRGGMNVSQTKQKWELVTTHTARRSFATNVYKSGFPAMSLMKITGHRSHAAFLIYLKITPEENAKQLAEHWNKSILKVV